MDLLTWMKKDMEQTKARQAARRNHVYTRAEIELLLREITQGDWYACHDGECACGMVHVVDGIGDPLLHIATDFDDADCVPNKEQQKANARFIARAPAIIRQLLYILEKDGA